MNKIIKKLLDSQKSIFVIILMGTHFVNLAFNLYLGKSLDAKDFGLVTFITSLLYFTNIIFLSMVSTMSYMIAYLQEKSRDAVVAFFQGTKKRGIILAVVASVIWLFFIPTLATFFRIEEYTSLILYVFIFVFGITSAINRGFLQGELQFIKAGIIIFSEAISKFFTVIALIVFGYKSLAYVAIPFSVLFTSIISMLFTNNRKGDTKKIGYTPFPVSFFLISSFASLSTMTFLSLDVILVKHFFTAQIAGEYALLALTGKTIYFLGSLFNNFLIPMVAKDLGQGKNPIKTFNMFFALTFLTVVGGFFTFGFFGHITAPLLFGAKAKAIVYLLPNYCLAIAGYTLSTCITTYHLAKKEYIFPALAIINAICVAIALTFYNASLQQIVQVLLMGSIIHLVLTIIVHSINSIQKKKGSSITV